MRSILLQNLMHLLFFWPRHGEGKEKQTMNKSQTASLQYITNTGITTQNWAKFGISQNYKYTYAHNFLTNSLARTNIHSKTDSNINPPTWEVTVKEMSTKIMTASIATTCIMITMTSKGLTEYESESKYD